jgi:hypothetical protein
MNINKEAGFEHESGVWVTNPFLSICSRFQVNPETYYGKSQKELSEIYGEKYFAFVSGLTKILIESLEWDSAADPVALVNAKKKEEKV